MAVAVVVAVAAVAAAVLLAAAGVVIPPKIMVSQQFPSTKMQPARSRRTFSPRKGIKSTILLKCQLYGRLDCSRIGAKAARRQHGRTPNTKIIKA